MSLFTSKRERNLWLWALIVLLLIYSTLWLTGLLAEILAENTLLTISFAIGLLLIAITVVGCGLVRKGKWREVWLIVGMVAVYGMILVRLGLQERSHLIEYSVLALL
ncbi:MAG: VanZ family protein, partial [Cyclobacteriaceae bacterium]|nr:VanZ family protein [Cyclobacteriaceae bacterium]